MRFSNRRSLRRWYPRPSRKRYYSDYDVDYENYVPYERPNPSRDTIQITDVNKTPRDIPVVPFTGQDTSRFDWSPAQRPIKDITRHNVAQEAAKGKKHLLVMPGSTGRDIELLKYYGIATPRSRWTIVERNIDYYNLLKKRHIFDKKDKVHPHIAGFHLLKTRDPAGKSYGPLFDFIWLDLVGNLTFKDIYWLKDTLSVHKDLDIFFTFSHTKRGKRQTHPVSILGNTLWHWNADEMEEERLNLAPNKKLKRSYDRRSKTRSAAMDRNIVTHQQLLNNIFDGWDFDLECWTYQDTTIHMLYHLNGFRKSKSVNPLMSQVDLILEIAENYKSGYKDDEIAETLGLDENKILEWRQINRLPGPDKYKEYRMAEGFETLLAVDADFEGNFSELLCQRLDEFHPFISSNLNIRCDITGSGINVISPRGNYQISVGDEVLYSNDDPYAIQITSSFLHPDNINALYSIFRCLFRGDEFLHPQLCSKVYEIEPGVGCFILSDPQQKAIATWIDSYESQEKAGIINLPTGMGKTVVAARIADYLSKKVKNFRILVITTQQEILNQTINKLKEHTPFSIEEYYCRFYGDYDKTKKCLQKPFVLATVASLAKPEYLNLVSRNHFDLIIVDEMHHINAETWLTITNKFKRKTYLLGLTATPFRGDIEKPAKIFNNNFLVKKSLNRGIWEGYLSWPDYRIFSDRTAYRGIKISRDEICLHEGYQEVIFETYMRETPNAKTIGFVTNVKSAQAMSKYFTRRGVPSAFLTGKHSDRIRKKRFKDFEKGKIKILFTVGILNEGVDIPDVEAILKLNKTNSPVKFLQQFGRGLRLHPGKRDVIILDFVENYNTVNAILNLGVFLGINIRNIIKNKNYKGSPREGMEDEEGLAVVPPINFRISDFARVLVRNQAEKEAPEDIPWAVEQRIKKMFKNGYLVWDIQTAINQLGHTVQTKTIVALCRNITPEIDTRLQYKLRTGLLLHRGLSIEIVMATTGQTEEEIIEYLDMIKPKAFRKHISSLLQGESPEDLAPKLDLTPESLQDLLDR